MAETPPKNPWPWWLKAALGLAIILAAAAGLLIYLDRSAENRWRRYVDELRAAGEPLTFAEIEARRAKAPTGPTAATVIERIIGRVGENGILERSEEPDFKEVFHGVGAGALEAAREIVNRKREILEELAAVTELPAGRFNFRYSDDTPLESLFPNHSPVRAVAKLIRLHHLVQLADGQEQPADQSVLMVFRLAQTLDQEPTLISYLSQLAFQAMGIEMIESALRAGELKTDAITRLDKALEQFRDSTDVRWAFWGERAGFAGVCELLHKGTLSPSEVWTLRRGSPPFLPNFLVRANQTRGAQVYSEYIKAADDPRELLKAGADVEVRVDALPKTQFLIRLMMPSYSRACVVHVRALAELECACAALAAERFRMKTGRFPASLAELVPDELDAAPLDPFDGQPLRLLVTDEGLIIYSVDRNRIDDGGTLIEEGRSDRDRDVGFRLLIPERRGLVIIDEPPEHEDEPE